MREKWARKDHHAMSKCMRMINKSIANDQLWRGRFVISEKKIVDKSNFEDGSGGMLYICYQFYDKETRISKFIHYSNYDYHHMWLDMNNFIVVDVDAWAKNPRPSISRKE